MNVASLPPLASRLGRRERILLAVTTMVALALRVIGLGTDALWFDESYRVLLANRPGLADAASFFYLHCSHPPLYLLLLRAWIELFGASEFSVRIPSVLAGTALVPIVFGVVRAHWNVATARLAAMFVAASPVMLYYSQDASMYTMLSLAWLGVLHFELVILGQRGRLKFGSCFGFTACLAASLLLFDLSLFLIPAIGIVLVLSRRLDRCGVLAAGCATAVALYLPHFFAALPELTSEARSYLAARWRNDPAWTTVASAISGLLPGGGSSAKGAKLPSDPHLRAGVLFFFLLAVVSALAVHTSHRQRRIHMSLCIWTVVPIACLTLSSLVKPIWDVGRHETAVTPALLILVACGVQRWAPPPRGLAIALFLALEAYSLRHFYTEKRPDFVHDSRGVARFLAESTTGNDLVVFLGYAREPVEYQLTRRQSTPRSYSFPRENDRHHGWVTFRQATDAAYYEAELDALASTVRALPPGACVWLVGYRLGDQMEKIARALRKVAGVTPLPPKGSWRLQGLRRDLPEE